jgi:hypothetical protein
MLEDEDDPLSDFRMPEDVQEKSPDEDEDFFSRAFEAQDEVDGDA